MPHITLEYSQDLAPLPDLHDLFRSIHDVLERLADAPVGNSKSRAFAVDSYIADGHPAHAMVHLDIELMEGRTVEQRAAVSHACLAVLVEAFTPASVGRELQSTVAITDLDRATYAKDPSGTIA